MKKIFLSLLLATFAIHGFSKEIISSFNDKDFVLLNGALLKESILDFPKNSYAQWMMIGHTKVGVLKNGKQYKLSVNVKVLGEFSPERQIEIVVRSSQGYEQWGDIAKASRYAVEDGFQNITIRFDVPNNDKTYCVYFWTIKDTAVQLKDFTLEEANFLKEIPIKKNSDKASITLKKLPTGAPEFEVLQPAPKNEIVVDAADFGVSEKSETNGSALRKALEHCKKIGASKLVVRKGVYKFFEENVTISLVQLKDFTLDCSDSTFIFRRKSINKNFWIDNNQRIKIANLKLDWDWDTDPLACIVKIINKGRTEKGEDFYDAECIEYANSSYPLYNKLTRVACMSPYDIKNKQVGEEFGQEAYYGYRGWDKGPRTEWINKNTLRVFSNINSMQIGKYYRLQHFYYESDCFMFGNCKHITFENVHVLSCRGAAFYGIANNQYVLMKNVRVAPPTKTRRPITSTADHFYITNSKGYIKILDCEFSYGGDDGFNVHGPVVYAKKIGEKTLLIKTPKGAYCYNKGSTIELMDAKFNPLKSTHKVVNFERIQKDGFEMFKLETETPLPEEQNGGFTIFNPEYCVGNVIIRNTHYHSNRARGLLLLSRNITIDNCRITHTEMNAMRFESGYAMIWSEGVLSKNIVVKNCLFETCNSTGTNALDGYDCDIFMGAYIFSYPSTEQAQSPVVEDVLFENNTFKNTFGLIAKIQSAKNVIFKNNTFINDIPRNDEKPYRACFYIKNSSKIRILDNTWISSKCVNSPRVIVDNSSKGILIQGNSIKE